MLATDALIAEGGELAELSAETMAGLDADLAAALEPAQPGRHHRRRIARALCANTRNRQATIREVDGLLVTLAPQGMTSPTEVAERIGRSRQLTGQTDAGELDGRRELWPAREEILNAAGIPTFPFPDTAARAFAYMWHYSDNLRALYETPELAGGVGGSQSGATAASRSSAR